MKVRTIAYGLFMALSILVSLTVAAIPAILLFILFLQNFDSFVMSLGWPFVSIKTWFLSVFGSMLPSFVNDYFWFIAFFVPIGLFCYGVFLGFLLIMFKLSRSCLPFLEDGYYESETEEWLLYEFYEVYYVLFPYFAGFFTIFFDTKPRHTLFGAKVGKNTIVGNGRLFNPERTIIGDNCFFGYDAILSGHVYEGNRLYLRTVRLGNNVTVGANAVILPGADIGDNVIIGANTVVPKDKKIPSNHIWVHGKAIPRRDIDIEMSGVLVRPEIRGTQVVVDEEIEPESPSEGEHL